jgi:hypothetical protein
LQERFKLLTELTARVARATAELQAARPLAGELPGVQRSELEELTERLQALQLLVANEAERARNAAEALARRTRRAEIMGRLHDATSAETRLPADESVHQWPDLSLDQPGSARQDGD